MNAYGFAHRALEMPSSKDKLFVDINPVQCNVLIAQIVDMMSVTEFDEVFGMWSSSFRRFFDIGKKKGDNPLDYDIIEEVPNSLLVVEGDMTCFSEYWVDKLSTDDLTSFTQQRVRSDGRGHVVKKSSGRRHCQRELMYLQFTDSLLFSPLDAKYLPLFPCLVNFCEWRLDCASRDTAMEVELWFNISTGELHFLAWLSGDLANTVLVSVR
jgi:hypothetical protein